MKDSISIVGAGNVAFRLTLALNEKGYTIDYIYNRTPKNVDKLIKVLKKSGSQAKATDSLEDVRYSDVIILAISDNAIAEVAKNLSSTIITKSTKTEPKFSHKPLLLHTSGSTPLSDLGISDKYDTGVLYPLMTLTKNKSIDFSKILFMLESSSEDGLKRLQQITRDLEAESQIADSQRRLEMHLAAVFASNFVNYMLSLSFDIAKNEHTHLLPLTMEMVRKAFLITPDSVQTGPARRGDEVTINKHLDLLDKMGLKEHKEVYEMLSKQIIKKFQNDKNK